MPPRRFHPLSDAFKRIIDPHHTWKERPQLACQTHFYIRNLHLALDKKYSHEQLTIFLEPAVFLSFEPSLDKDFCYTHA